MSDTPTGGATAPDPWMMGLAPDGQTVVLDPAIAPKAPVDGATAPTPTIVPEAPAAPTLPVTEPAPAAEEEPSLSDALAKFMAEHGDGTQSPSGEGTPGEGEAAAPTPPPVPSPDTTATPPEAAIPPGVQPLPGQQAPPAGTYGAPAQQQVPGIHQPPPVSPWEQAAQQFYGRPVTNDEINGLFDVANRLRALPPEQVQQVEAMLYPGVAGVPPVAPAAPPVPTNQPTIDPDLGDYPDVAAAVAPMLAPIQQQMSQVTQYMQAQAQQQAAAQQQAVASQVETGVNEFVQQYALQPDEAMALQQQVAQQGIMTGLYQATGSGQAAIKQAMEQVYWGTPTWRQREFKRQQDAQTAAATQAAADEAKARKAGALAPGGATVSRTDPVPTTKTQRQAALSEGIAAAMSQGN